MTTTNSRVLAIFLVMLVIANCSSVAKVTVHGVRRPVSYSDLPFAKRRSFAVQYQIEVNTYTDEITGEMLDQVLNRELDKTPGARGIKNLDIRTYDSAFTSLQLFNFFGVYIGFFRAIFGTGIKDVRVTGDIY